MVQSKETKARRLNLHAPNKPSHNNDQRRMEDLRARRDADKRTREREWEVDEAFRRSLEQGEREAMGNGHYHRSARRYDGDFNTIGEDSYD